MAVRANQPVPDRIQNAPSLWPGLELYYIAFQDLSSSRTMGFGPGPIPWLAIEQYCNMMELDDLQREAMHHHIVKMDTAFLKYQKKKSES